MRQSLALAAGFAAIAAASPAAQAIDFAAVNAAPTPTLTGPEAATVTAQTVTVDSAAVSASATAAVTGIATASATAAEAGSKKRWLNWFGHGGWGAATSTVKQQQTTTTPVKQQPTTTSISTSSITTTTTADATTNTEPAPTRVPCEIQPDGYGPKVQPDTPEAFAAYADFAAQANAAVTPSGYTATFKNWSGSVQGVTYMGLTTYKTYDVAACGAQCDATALCTGFNIYIERDPYLDPNADAPACPNPVSITNYKCTLWGSSVDKSIATNYGQAREDFTVVIAGSNAYTKEIAPAPQPGWEKPQACGGGKKAHNHPNTCLGQHFFPGPYNPSYCAQYAVSQNAKNAPHIPSLLSWMFKLINFNPWKCTFFNSYMLKKNGKPMGTYCSLYAQGYKGSEATYSPGQQGGDSWDIESSWSFSLN